jgi:hypothetical protein
VFRLVSGERHLVMPRLPIVDIEGPVNPHVLFEDIGRECGPLGSDTVASGRWDGLRSRNSSGKSWLPA